MSDYSQPGLHPDPDSLSAFAEGVLPDHERQNCLAHLAVCPECREVVFLLQGPMPEPQAEKVPFWKRWFQPIPVLAAATAMAAVTVFTVVSLRNQPPKPERQLVAAMPAQQDLQAQRQVPESPVITAPAVPLPRKKAIQTAPSVAKPPQEIPPPEPQPSVAIMAQAGASALSSTAIQVQPGLATDDNSRFVPTVAKDSVAFRALPSPARTGITGSITGPTGASVSNAVVEIRPPAGAPVKTLKTDSTGRFEISGLEPGRYSLSITSPGFIRADKVVDLSSAQMARADATLMIGTVSETVSVTTDPALASGSVALPMSARGSALAGREPAVATVILGKVMLSLFDDGRLLRSDAAGKKSKAVQPAWQGKPSALLLATDPSNPKRQVFQLTAADGKIWISRDGNHWTKPAPQKN